MLKNLFELDEKKFMTYVDENGIIDDKLYEDLPIIFNRYLMRESYIKKYGFIPYSRNLLEAIAKEMEGKKVLSVMAGTAMLEKNLLNMGVDIKITDDKSWSNKNYWNSDNDDIIEKIDCVEAVKKYGNWADIIFVSWPPYNDDIMNDLYVEAVKHDVQIMYVGEDIGGCTASELFFTSINDIEEIDSINDAYSRWAGIYDKFYYVV